MSDFVYRTFLMPHLLIKMGALAGTRPADPDFLGNQFMQGEVSTENANQLLAFIHPASVLLNLAGYHVEGAALAAKTSTGSAAVYVNMAKCEYTTATSTSSEAKTALKKLINLDFPSGSTICLGLRLAPRAKWWQANGPGQYYALPVSLSSGQQLNTTAPGWVLLGGTGSVPASPAIHEVSNLLQTPLTQLQEEIADKLAAEWQKTPTQRGGLLQYLNPTNWGDDIVGEADQLRDQYQLIKGSAQTVYDWLAAPNSVDFGYWLTQPTVGNLAGSLRIAQAARGGSTSVTQLKVAIESLFVGTHSFDDLARYSQLWNLLGYMVNQNSTLPYFEVLMFLEELTVIDMLGRVRQSGSITKETLPFDITGFYEQVAPVNVSEDDPSTYDFHTLQINQAGRYAQGFWQERVAATCSDDVNGGRYRRFNHYRFCLEEQGNQSYEPGETFFTLNLAYWQNTNLMNTKPYLKSAASAQPEILCVHHPPAGVAVPTFFTGTAAFTKVDPLPFDTLVCDEDVYFSENPVYGVELEVVFGNQILLFQRVSDLPYLGQADLIAMPEQNREALVITQRFPLHSLDKVRILAGGSYLIEEIQTWPEIFLSDNILSDTGALNKVESIDYNFAEWMACYVCYDPLPSPSLREGPQIEQVRQIIINMLAKATMEAGNPLEVLTALTVFLDYTNVYHRNLMPYTRAILGDSLPAVTDEMRSAVRNNTAGLHVYRWETDGLGEKGQGLLWDGTKLALKMLKPIRTFLEILDKADQVVTGLSIDQNIFLLTIEKISPLEDANGNPYPGWGAGQKKTYLGGQVGGGLGVTKGVFLKADSAQTMYSGVNWDPSDFSGQLQTYGASAGLVFDTDMDYVPQFLRIDVNGWIENKLQQWSFVDLVGSWVGFDANNVKLGLSLSMSFFMGNTWDGQARLPIRSGPSFIWVDYSNGVAAIAEANAMLGGIILLPAKDEDIQKMAAEITPSAGNVDWRTIQQMTSFQTESAINVWQLTEANKAIIRQSAAEYLASFRNRSTKLTISGHASPIGTEANNMWLSQKRAQTVYDYIRSILTDKDYSILPLESTGTTTIQGFGELYATNWAFYGADDRAPEWQTVMIYLNGQIITRIGEQIIGEVQ